jgi:hypothetical protein
MENDMLNTEERIVQEISHPLYNSKGWIKLIGIMMVIYGVLVALSVFGIIIAWLPIWLGIILIQVAGRIADARASGNKMALIKAQQSLSTYFTIYGVLILIGLIGIAVMIIVFLSIGIPDNIQDFTGDYY